MGEHRLFYLGLGLVVIAAVATQTTAFYYLQNTRNLKPSTSALPCPDTGPPFICVNMLINYGNTTAVWHNVSDVPAGWNSYQLTTRIANLQATTFGPPLNEHLVTGIDGVKMTGPYSWGLWLFCQDKTAWVYSPVGADSIVLTNRSTLAWVYERDASQPPLSGEALADSC